MDGSLVVITFFSSFDRFFFSFFNITNLLFSLSEIAREGNLQRDSQT